MKTITTIIVASLIVESAFGRIGETPAECQTRYGKPLKIELEEKKLFFHKGPMIFGISFFEGKCDQIHFRKAEKDILGTSKEITDNEIQLLLKSNGGDKKWKQNPILSLTKEWETEGGELMAHYDPMDNTLSIYTKESLIRQMEKTKEKEKEKLDGF